MVKKYFVILLIIVVSCKNSKLITIGHIDQLNTLRLDGCYFNTNDFYEASPVYFFYKNGILFHIGWVSRSEFDAYINQANMKEFHQNTIKRKGDATHWGAINIFKQDIVFELWTPSSGGGLRTIIHKGKILNDTTFVIKELINNYENGKKYVVNETFHFKQFSPKPDSTNQFVK